MRPCAVRPTRHPQPEQEVLRGGLVDAVATGTGAVVARVRAARLHAPRPGTEATERVVAWICSFSARSSRVVRHAHRRTVRVALRVEYSGGRRAVRERGVAERPLVRRHAAANPVAQGRTPLRRDQSRASEQSDITICSSPSNVAYARAGIEVRVAAAVAGAALPVARIHHARRRISKLEPSVTTTHARAAVARAVPAAGRAGGPPDLKLRSAPVLLAAADLGVRAGVGVALVAVALGSSQGTVGAHVEVAAQVAAPHRPPLRPDDLVAGARTVRQEALRPCAARPTRHPQPEQEVLRGTVVVAVGLPPGLCSIRCAGPRSTPPCSTTRHRSHRTCSCPGWSRHFPCCAPRSASRCTRHTASGIQRQSSRHPRTRRSTASSRPSPRCCQQPSHSALRPTPASAAASRESADRRRLPPRVRQRHRAASRQCMLHARHRAALQSRSLQVRSQPRTGTAPQRSTRRGRCTDSGRSGRCTTARPGRTHRFGP